MEKMVLTLQHKVIVQSTLHLVIILPVSTISKFNNEGPRSETVERFWMMVWEHRIKTIVMLTRCVEMNKAGRPNTQSLYNNTP